MGFGDFSQAIEIQHKLVDDVLDRFADVNLAALENAVRSVVGRLGFSSNWSWSALPMALYGQAENAMNDYESLASAAETMDLQLR